LLVLGDYLVECRSKDKRILIVKRILLQLHCIGEVAQLASRRKRRDGVL
jgi:hypothetical protein